MPVGFVPWSLTVPSSHRPDGLWSSAGWFMENVPEDVSCIVCFSETEATQQGLEGWHHCRVCSAMWCDSCMEGMYNNTVRDAEAAHEAELRCPQCRKSVGEMQFEARLERVVKNLGCSDVDAAHVLLGYETLLVEVVHLCEARQDGMPYYSVELEAAARILSRDETCDVVEAFQGRAEAARLRRCLRSNDYPSAATIVLEGYVAQLRQSVPHASLLGVLSLLRDYLKKHVVLDAAQAAAATSTVSSADADEAPPPYRAHRAALLTSVEGLLRAQQRQPQQPQPQEQRRPLTSGRGSSRKRRRGA